MQLVLDINLQQDKTFENFFKGNNETVIDVLRSAAMGGGEEQVFYCSGQYSVGLSHLLQACCHQASQSGLRSVYLPLAEIIRMETGVLENLEQLDLVCFDDVDEVAGLSEWEEALFHAFNRIKDQGGRMIFASHSRLKDLPVQLPDLKSRLGWGYSCELNELHDEFKIALLQQEAKSRGFSLSDDITRYILNHYPRDMASLKKVIQRLDETSLIEKHKITLPFVKVVLNQ